MHLLQDSWQIHRQHLTQIVYCKSTHSIALVVSRLSVVYRKESDKEIDR